MITGASAGASHRFRHARMGAPARAPGRGRVDPLDAGRACRCTPFPHEGETSRPLALRGRTGSVALVQPGERPRAQPRLGRTMRRRLSCTPSVQVKQVKLVHGSSFVWMGAFGPVPMPGLRWGG